LLVQHVVGVLLRVDDPDEQVDQRQQAVHLLGVGGLDRVVVGQVEQHQAGQLLLGVAVQCGLPLDAPIGATWRKSSRAVALLPQMQAAAWEVVGRITPTSANCNEESALNSEDFPDPVPPTSATTV